MQLVNQPWNLKTGQSVALRYHLTAARLPFTFLPLPPAPLCQGAFLCLSMMSSLVLASSGLLSSIPLHQLPFSFQPPFSSSQLPLPLEVFGNTCADRTAVKRLSVKGSFSGLLCAGS